MFRFFTLFLIFVTVSLQISAQCGVYFKESNRQVFSNSFATAAFEDFDGDGLEDLFGYSPTRYVNGGPSDFQIYYYKRLAANSFDTTAKSSAITNVRLVFGGFGDVNGDGKKDVVVTHISGSFLSIRAYLNDGTGSFTTATPAVEVPGTETVFAVGDLNNDGKADVVTSTVTSPTSTLYYRLTQPDNSFGAPVAITTYSGFMGNGNSNGIIGGRPLLSYSYPMLIDDFDNDGAKDIAFVSTEFNLIVLTNNGSLSFTQTFTTPFPTVTSKLKAYDFNNDGKKDFISNASNTSQNTARLAVNNGNNTFTASTLTLPVGSTFNYYSGSFYTNDFKVADFDNDGDQDVIYPGINSYAFLRNQGNATFNAQTFKSLISLNAVANLDGDGKADSVALIRPLIDGAYSLNNTYFNLHSAVSFRKNVCDPIGQTKKIDFNGDGFADRAFFNTTNANWRYYTNVYSQSTAQVNFQWGVAGDLPVPNDYDGDGITDYAVFRPSDGTWWIYRSSDNQSYALHFGIAEDKPVPADYDGDGRADIAVFRPSTGDWHFFFSQTNQYGAVHFGSSEDKPLPADYDGDGKADVCVFRPSEGNWYRFNSSDYSVFIVHYGVGTDKPIPGDYDGDGKANIAVFRNGAWYVLRDNFSTSIFNWGTTGDEPYFEEGVESRVNAFRRSTSLFWAVNAQFYPLTNPIPSGNTANEVLVSSILPPE